MAKSSALNVGAGTFVLLGFAALGSRGWARIPESAPGEERIEVYARQFAWHFRYSGRDGVFGHGVARD